jgi:hypothetical protein
VIRAIDKKSSITEKANMITREEANSRIRDGEIADHMREEKITDLKKDEETVDHSNLMKEETADHSNLMKEETADHNKEGRIKRVVRLSKLANNSATIDRGKESINKISNKKMDRSRVTLCSR